MKNVYLGGFVFGVLLLLIGCNQNEIAEKNLQQEKVNSPRPLLENAAPENSAMAIYAFDGENTSVHWLFERETEDDIIAEINELEIIETGPESIENMTTPSYGITISDKQGFEIWLTYSNGIWLCKDGTTYGAMYDFNNIIEKVLDIPSTRTDKYPGGIAMPNASYLGEIDKKYYAKAEQISICNDIKMSIEKIESNRVTVKLSNHSDTNWTYGNPFELHMKIEDEWYKLPVRLSNYGFAAIAYILEPAQSKECICDLTPYGELKPGTYRIAKDGLAAEFEIK